MLFGRYLRMEEARALPDNYHYRFGVRARLS
jgi:hypothetical protein